MSVYCPDVVYTTLPEDGITAIFFVGVLIGIISAVFLYAVYTALFSSED